MTQEEQIKQLTDEVAMHKAAHEKATKQIANMANQIHVGNAELEACSNTIHGLTMGNTKAQAQFLLMQKAHEQNAATIEALNKQVADLSAKHADYVVSANHTVAELNQKIAELQGDAPDSAPAE